MIGNEVYKIRISIDGDAWHDYVPYNSNGLYTSLAVAKRVASRKINSSRYATVLAHIYMMRGEWEIEEVV